MSRSVLIVEDEPVAAETLQEYLADEEDFHLVGEARTGPDAIEALERLEPDVLLLDVEL
ncbi:MAG: LytR/AlgR family response regulator transcription factor, partial [Gemmatimonadota bacterium]